MPSHWPKSISRRSGSMVTATPSAAATICAVSWHRVIGEVSTSVKAFPCSRTEPADRRACSRPAAERPGSARPTPENRRSGVSLVSACRSRTTSAVGRSSRADDQPRPASSAILGRHGRLELPLCHEVTPLRGSRGGLTARSCRLPHQITCGRRRFNTYRAKPTRLVGGGAAHRGDSEAAGTARCGP